MIKILLLEDDVVFAESMIDLLECEGFNILHVGDGEAAHKHAEDLLGTTA